MYHQWWMSGLLFCQMQIWVSYCYYYYSNYLISNHPSSWWYLFLGNDRPQLHDLFFKVIPRYAAHWEALGAILVLNDYEIISKDYVNRSTEGCTTMLMKWFQKDLSATWGKLYDAINLLTQSLTSAVVRSPRFPSSETTKVFLVVEETFPRENCIIEATCKLLQPWTLLNHTIQ